MDEHLENLNAAMHYGQQHALIGSIGYIISSTVEETERELAMEQKRSVNRATLYAKSFKPLFGAQAVFGGVLAVGVFAYAYHKGLKINIKR